jgi:hypothetical protein
MKAKTLIFFLFVLFSKLSFASQFDEEFMGGMAVQNSQEMLKVQKEWVTDSDAQQPVCQPDSASSFDPGFEKPKEGSQLMNDLCDMLSPNVYSSDNTRITKKCEFTKFSPCEIEMKQRFQYNVSAYVTQFLWSFPPKNYPAGPRTVPEISFVAIHCEPVTVAGIIPKWMCGGGFDFSLYLDDEVQFDAGESLHRLGEQSDARYKEIITPARLKRFLEKLGLAR